MSVLLCVGGDLEVEIVRRLTEIGGGVSVERRCADAAELLAAAEAGIGSVCVVREWDLVMADRLHRSGVAIVGIAQGDGGGTDPRLRGCDAVASPYPSEVIACVVELAQGRVAGRAAGGSQGGVVGRADGGSQGRAAGGTGGRLDPAGASGDRTGLSAGRSPVGSGPADSGSARGSARGPVGSGPADSGSARGSVGSGGWTGGLAGSGRGTGGDTGGSWGGRPGGPDGRIGASEELGDPDEGLLADRAGGRLTPAGQTVWPAGADWFPEGLIWDSESWEQADVLRTREGPGRSASEAARSRRGPGRSPAKPGENGRASTKKTPWAPARAGSMPSGASEQAKDKARASGVDPRAAAGRARERDRGEGLGPAGGDGAGPVRNDGAGLVRSDGVGPVRNGDRRDAGRGAGPGRVLGSGRSRDAGQMQGTGQVLDSGRTQSSGRAGVVGPGGNAAGPAWGGAVGRNAMDGPGAAGVSVAAEAPVATNGPDVAEAPVAADGPTPRGRIVAVWGTGGAPGRSTLARDMAFAAARGQSVLLVDADTRRPCLAQLLGAERETSALIAVARRLSRGDPADVLRECAVTVGGLDFLAGLNSGLRWREVPSAPMEEMWRRIRLGWDIAVVDCAPDCESQGDVLERDAVTRSLLVNADIVLCVGRASPVGVKRLLGSLDEAALGLGVRPVPVIVRSGAAKSSDVREISRILAVKDAGEPLWVREDPNGYAKAEREGVPLREASPSSPAVRDVLAVAGRLGIAAPRPPKRRVSLLRRGRGRT